MNLEDVFAQIEEELRWRQDEIRFFQNLYNSHIENESEKDISRRSLILLLYAHFEGFCKFALALYIEFINSEEVSCNDVNPAIAAAALNDMFHDLRNHQRKNVTYFRNNLPDDEPLHVFARNREFVERSHEFLNTKVNIPDKVVNTESNLKPVVLKKNLYKLGFDIEQVSSVEVDINKLLYYRNSIGHGERKDGIPIAEYDKIYVATNKAITFVRLLVIEAISNRSFLRR